MKNLQKEDFIQSEETEVMQRQKSYRKVTLLYVWNNILINMYEHKELVFVLEYDEDDDEDVGDKQSRR